MTPLQEVKASKKRCISMGRHSGWRPEYDEHPLAACSDNYTAALDVEMENDEVCYLAVLGFIHAMAKKINEYCDNNKIVGDAAAQYWLERFLWRCDVICQWDCLTHEKLELPIPNTIRCCAVSMCHDGSCRDIWSTKLK